jgi:hypothetical protein
LGDQENRNTQPGGRQSRLNTRVAASHNNTIVIHCGKTTLLRRLRQGGIGGGNVLKIKRAFAGGLSSIHLSKNPDNRNESF